MPKCSLFSSSIVIKRCEVHFVEVLSSGLWDLPKIGWRVSWVVKSKINGINPPHNGIFSLSLVPWGEELDGDQHWPEENFNDIDNRENGISDKSSDGLWEEPDNGNVVPEANPEQGSEVVGLLGSPVVVSGSLLNAVVPALSVDLIEIELKKSISGKGNEKGPPEEYVEPSLSQLVGKVSGCKEGLIP